MTKLTFDAIINFGTKGVRKVADQVDNIKGDLQQADNLSRKLGDTKTGNSAKKAAGLDPRMDTPGYRQNRSVQGTRGGARNFSGLLGGDSQGTLVGAYAELAANVFALSMAFNALSNAARVEQLTQGLEILGARGGIALKLTANNLREVTDNAISTADAMRAVAQASSAGLGADEIERLGKVARGASLALGRDASESMDRLTRGAIKLEPELLDELGIMVRLDEAVKEYALQNNKAASSLTLTERRQAFLNAVLEEGERKFGDINDQIASNPFDRLAASARDFATGLGGVINNFLGPIANFVADNPFALLVPGIFLASKALNGLGVNAGLSALAINDLFNTQMNQFTDDLFEGVDGVDELKVSIRELEPQSIDELKHSFVKARQELEAKNGAMTDAQYRSYLLDKTTTVLRARLMMFLLTLRAIAAQLAIMAIQMLAITAVVAAATAAYKFFEKNVLGLTKELKEQRKVFKELGEAAQDTVKQVAMMLDPGKRLEGEAFDAVLNTLKATNDEMKNYIRLQQIAKQEALEEQQTRLGTGEGPIRMLATREEGQRKITYSPLEDFEAQYADQIREAGSLEQALQQLMMDTGNVYYATSQTTAGAYAKIEESLKRVNGFKANEEKALVGSLKALLAILPLEERNAVLQQFLVRDAEKQVELFNEIIGSSAGIEKRFASMADLTRDIEKNVKGFFPKETKNDLEDLAGNYNDLYNQLTAESPELLSSLDLRATGDLLLNNADAIDKTVIALQAQGYQISNNKALEDQRLKVKSAETALDEAKKGTDQKAITAAQILLDTERGILGQVVQENSQYIRQLATLTLLEANRERVLQTQKKIVDLELKNATLAGKQNKYFIERLNTLRDIRYAATGADINFPKEATIEYRLQIANMELETAQKIAGIKKRSIELESALEAVKLTNELAESRKEQQSLAVGLPSYDLLIPAPIFDKDGMLRSFDDFQKQIVNRSQQGQNFAIQSYYTAAREQSLGLLQDFVNLQKSQADNDVNRATDVRDRLKAEKDGYSLTLRQLKTERVQLDNQQKITDAVSARIAALSGNVALEGQFAALLEKERLPAINKEISLLGERISQQKDLRDEIEKTADPDKAERLRIVNERIDGLETEQSILGQQKDTIDQVNASYSNGLLAQQTALQNRAKELGLVKEIAAAQKGYNEAAADLSRSQIELGARREFRDLSAGEEQQIEAKAAQLKIENALADREMMIAEYALRRSNAELEHSLLMLRNDELIEAKRDRLKKDGLSSEEIDERLGGAIAVVEQLESNFQSNMGLMDRAFQMQVQTADMSIQTMLNDFGHLLNVALPNTLTGMADTLFGADGTLNPEALAKALQDTITNAVNKVAGPPVTPKTPAESFQGRVDEQIGGMRRSAGEELSATLQGFTGQAREFFTREMRNPAVDPEKIRKAAVEMQTLQLATEGLNNVMNTVQSSVEDAFISILDGSKKAEVAFADMAQAILKQILQMIVKMLVFKAIQTGLNLIPGVGPALSAGFSTMANMTPLADPSATATGGIMQAKGYAAGGILSRRDRNEGVIKQPTYLVGEGRYNEAVVPLPNGRAIPVQMHGGQSSQQNNVSVNINMESSGNVQTQSSGNDLQNLGALVATAVQKELVAQKMPGGILNKYGAA